jgi:hypothetical protein
MDVLKNIFVIMYYAVAILKNNAKLHIIIKMM